MVGSAKVGGYSTIAPFLHRVVYCACSPTQLALRKIQRNTPVLMMQLWFPATRHHGRQSIHAAEMFFLIILFAHASLAFVVL